MNCKRIFICLLLLCGFQNVIFGFHPRYRDEFYIENKTSKKIVVVFETIGLLGANLSYGENDYIITLNVNGWAVAADKSFRTIRSGRQYEIGFSQYNDENFNKKSPREKFSSFFKFILIFNENGDLLQRIDDFTQYRIEDRTKDGPSLYVLIVE